MSRNNISSTLIGRIRSAYEQNPQENPESINVRDTLGMAANYPAEEDSTTIYRLAEAELIEELIGENYAITSDAASTWRRCVCC